MKPGDCDQNTALLLVQGCEGHGSVQWPEYCTTASAVLWGAWVSAVNNLLVFYSILSNVTDHLSGPLKQHSEAAPATIRTCKQLFMGRCECKNMISPVRTFLPMPRKVKCFGITLKGDISADYMCVCVCMYVYSLYHNGFLIQFPWPRKCYYWTAFTQDNMKRVTDFKTV
jgi:hypothetical protein